MAATNGGSSEGELEEPRQIEDDELALLSAYLGEPDLQALREHVHRIWRKACGRYRGYAGQRSQPGAWCER